MIASAQIIFLFCIQKSRVRSQRNEETTHNSLIESTGLLFPTLRRTRYDSHWFETESKYREIESSFLSRTNHNHVKLTSSPC
jgi:hypothetical protein